MSIQGVRAAVRYSVPVLFGAVAACAGQGAEGGRAAATSASSVAVPSARPAARSAPQLEARGDDELDDTVAIQAAIDAARATPGGRVVLPAGTYYLSDAPPLDQVALKIEGAQQLNFSGAGATRTRLVLRSNIDAHVIAISSSEGVQVSNLSIDGTRENRRDTHGVRVASCMDVTLRALQIHSVAHYGIGLQRGQLRRITIEDVRIDDTGGDGIDFKNTEGTNDEIVIRNVQVSRPGQVSPRQAGIDIRGRARLSSIEVRQVPPGATGIRFREDGGATGPGGHGSTLGGFLVEGAPGSSGVAIASNDVTVGEGSVVGTDTGVNILGNHARVSGVVVRGARLAFRVEPSAEEAWLDACHGDSSRAGVWLEGKSTRISRSVFRDNERCGICLRPGATASVLSSNEFFGRGAQVEDASQKSPDAP